MYNANDYMPKERGINTERIREIRRRTMDARLRKKKEAEQAAAAQVKRK